jgi:leader peptidase (prepilin peptidase)/N-methyltransferase
VVEVIGAALALALFLRCGLSWQYAFLLVASNLFVLIALIDWQHLIIPNTLVAAGMTIALLSHVLNGMPEVLVSVFSVGGSSFVMMLLKAGGDAIFKKQSMGMGDVKLAGVVGLFVGFTGFLAVLWIAALIGILYAGAMRMLGCRGEFTSRGLNLIRSSDAGSISNLLPFGSFLSVVTILFFVFDVQAQQIIDTWLILMQ